jgi:hypothetical protein
VVHSLFASTDDWDDQLASLKSGWPWFFQILRLYLTHFQGQRCSAFRVMGAAAAPASTAWEALTGSLGLAGATVGRRSSARAGVPPFAGLVERTGEGGHSHGFLLRLDTPGPGIVALFALPMGGQVYLVIDFFLYGDRAAAAAGRDEPVWQAWMQAHFPTEVA